jgi:glycosyltransferase involved in cell wall biosynthesis
VEELKFLFHFYDLHQRAGIQRAICELSNALVERSHEVIIASYTKRCNIAYRLDDRVTLEELPYPESQEKRMWTWIRKIRWGIRQAGVLRSIVKRNRPTVVVDHGTALGLLYPFPTIGGAPFVLQRHFPVKAFPYGRLLYRMLSFISSFKTVIVLTKDIAADFRASGYRRIAVIPNPIPDEVRPFPLPHESPRIGLLLGRSTPQKGFDLFLKALALIRSDGWRFLIIGPGVESDPLLADLVRQHDLSARVSLMSATNDPYGCIRRSSCVIMPSRYEALPMVALESLGFGRPLIASDVDGLRNLIVNGVNGLVFPRCDVGKLAECLTSLCDHPARLVELAANAPSTITGYDADSVVEAWRMLVVRLQHGSLPAA